MKYSVPESSTRSVSINKYVCQLLTRTNARKLAATVVSLREHKTRFEVEDLISKRSSTSGSRNDKINSAILTWSYPVGTPSIRSSSSGWWLLRVQDGFVAQKLIGWYIGRLLLSSPASVKRSAVSKTLTDREQPAARQRGDARLAPLSVVISIRVEYRSKFWCCAFSPLASSTARNLLKYRSRRFVKRIRIFFFFCERSNALFFFTHTVFLIIFKNNGPRIRAVKSYVKAKKICGRSKSNFNPLSAAFLSGARECTRSFLDRCIIPHLILPFVNYRYVVRNKNQLF